MRKTEKLYACLRVVREKTDFVPRVAIILGSGLGTLAKEMKVLCEVPYANIPAFPTSTVSGHRGRFLFGTIEGVPVVCMEGRVHYYEGYTMEEVVMPIRLMRLLGARILLLTNAAGGINASFSPGDFMLIRDHISFLVPSPLLGKNKDELGTRFPDMSAVYDAKLQEIFLEASHETGIPLSSGVYAQLMGPQYETPAEIRALGALGADAVGMSTACEAIAARHAGFLVGGVSFISNMAAGISETPLSHQEVKAAADKAGKLFQNLMCAALRRISCTTFSHSFPE